jgi:hypothetical protein
MDNVQNCDSYINMLSSQSYRSYDVELLNRNRSEKEEPIMGKVSQVTYHFPNSIPAPLPETLVNDVGLYSREI